MNSRPRLKSHAQPLRRGPGSLQLGLSPRTAIVLEGLSEAEIAVAEGLDGRMDIPSLYALATAAGVTADRVTSLIATLDGHHLLVETTTDRASPSRSDERRRHVLRPEATAVAIAAAYDLPGDGVD